MLPKIPYQTNAKQNIQVSFSGINLSDSYKDGALEDSKMISARRWPYIATKLPRYTDGAADYKHIFSWNGLWVVNTQNQLTHNNGSAITTLSPSSTKTFIPMYQKMVILPDRVYIDTSGNEENWTAKSLSATASGTGATIEEEEYEEGGGYVPVLTQSWQGVDFTTIFKVNDVVQVSGFSLDANNGWFKITDVTATTLKFTDNVMTEETAVGTITIERPVPEFTYACEHDNRLWGCKDNVIYCSSLGDPTNFWQDGTTSADSYQFEVATEGDFTGCADLSGSVIFFKEHSIVKILGNYASNFQSTIYQTNGVKNGCGASICSLNETLIYMGVDGVYSYSGGTAQLMSSVLGEKRLNEVISGTDGENYYMSGKDSENTQNAVFMTYNIRTGIWLIEDDTYVSCFTLDGDVMKFVAGNKLYIENDKQKRNEINWSFTFKPYIEKQRNSSSLPFFLKKNYSYVYVRTEMEKETWCKIEIKEDDGNWKEVQTITGKSGLQYVKLPIGRCDKFQLRFSGSGEFTLMNIDREFRLGSAK